MALATALALRFLDGIEYLRDCLDIPSCHHEKWDGSGYPEGLAGEAIPLPARLMALADVFDALISKRSYKPAFPIEKATEIIVQGRGQHFDPEVVDAYLANIDEFIAIAARHADQTEQGVAEETGPA